MTIDDIQQLIAGDETRTLELKKTTGELKDAMQTACAFLNTDGGWLLFGIAPTTLKIVGQQVTDNTRREIAHELTKIEPAIDVRVEYVDVPLKESFQVIAMHFDSWPRGTVPFTYDSRSYYRVESTTKIMPREMFEARIKDSKPHLFAWERQPADGLTIDDLDEELIMNSVRGGIRGGRLVPTAQNEKKEQILSKFKLLKGGTIINAAVALYTKETYGYPQLLLRMARFKGSGKNEFGDNRTAEGNFFTLLDEGMDFLFKHLNLSGKIVGLQREERLEIPEVALREALTNALCHRTFDNDSESVSLAVYDDKVEIGNPGCFPHNLTPDTIKRNHESYPRNPLMASVLYQTNYLERWGSGIQRMIAACKEQGVEEPFYEVQDGFVHIVFKRPNIKQEDEPNEPNNDPNRDPNPVQDENKPWSDVASCLTERQIHLLAVIDKDTSQPLPSLAKALGVSVSTIKREIKSINSHLCVKWNGSTRVGEWIITDK